MSTLVTGGAGYIGSHVVLSLLDAGREVVVLDNLITGFRHAVAADAELVVGDIGDADLVRRLIRQHEITDVLHFAGSTVVPESVHEPLKYYLNNTAKSSVLIDECLQGGVRNFVFSSTAAVYGTASDKPVSEEVALEPMSPYATSKLMTEQVLQDAAAVNPDFNYIALRYFNVAGADPQGRSGQSTAKATHLIKVACQAALGDRPQLEIYGTDYPTPDGTGVRDYIHVTDLADAHLLALEHLAKTGQSEVLNCGYGHGYSVLDVIKAVEAVCGIEALPVKKVERRDGDPAAVVANSDKLRDLFEWKPRYDDLKTIVRTAWEWEKRCLQRKAG